MKRADAEEAAEIITRMLAEIDTGALDATAMQRNMLAGALLTLNEIAKPPTRRKAKHQGEAPPE